jgi:hypothetical protein
MTQEPTGDDTEALIREKQIEELNAKLKESLDQYAESLKRAAELSVSFPLDTTPVELGPWLVSHTLDAQGMRFPAGRGHYVLSSGAMHSSYSPIYQGRILVEILGTHIIEADGITTIGATAQGVSPMGKGWS